MGHLFYALVERRFIGRLPRLFILPSFAHLRAWFMRYDRKGRYVIACNCACAASARIAGAVAPKLVDCHAENADHSDDHCDLAAAAGCRLRAEPVRARGAQADSHTAEFVRRAVRHGSCRVGRRRAVEVQLHVSENGGPWRPYANVAPLNGSILFRASRDGEYRFLVRTKDDHGELQPPGPPNAELTVILDTDPPVLELLVERGQGGELHARWRVRDTHLRPDSLRLEYQVGPDGPWVPVAIDMPVMGAMMLRGKPRGYPRPVLSRSRFAPR